MEKLSLFISAFIALLIRMVRSFAGWITNIRLVFGLYTQDQVAVMLHERDIDADDLNLHIHICWRVLNLI